MSTTASHTDSRSSIRSGPQRVGQLFLAFTVLLTVLVAVAPRTSAAARVQFNAGRLTVIGDATAEIITISNRGGGEYLVEIDGQPVRTVQGLTAVTVRSGRGDDAVSLLDVTLSGDVLIDLGDGDNRFRIDNSEIRRNLTITGGNRNDSGRIDRSIVEGRTNVRLRNGIDRLVVNGGEYNTFSFLPGTVGAKRFVVERSPLFHKTTSIRGGRDADVVNLGNARMLGRTTVLLGSGDDSFLIGGQSQTDALRIDGGAGADQFELHDPDVRGAASIRGGAGDDELTIVNGAWRNVQILAGSGNDRAYLFDAGIEGNLDIRMDAGDDLAVLNGDGRTVGTTRLNGGSGFDTLGELDWRFGRAPTVTGFE